MKQQIVDALKPLVSRIRTDVTAVKRNGVTSWTREALDNDRLLHHVNGGPARGCSPIKAGESVTLVGLYDLDSHKGATSWEEMTAVALDLCGTLEMVGMAPVVFRSSGGHGIHIYLVWDAPQDAYSVRQFMAEVLGSIGYASGTKGVAEKQIEIFPKQDAVPVDGRGNMFILPMAGASEPLDLMFDLAPVGKAAAVALEWPASTPVPVLHKPVRELRAASVAGAAAATENSPEYTTLCQALDTIPNAGADELDYDSWRDIVFAIHHATDGSELGLALAHAFSERSTKYDPDFLDNRVWPYITTREGGITEGKIFQIARQHYGWSEDYAAHFDVLPPLPKAPAEIASQAAAAAVLERDFDAEYGEVDTLPAWTTLSEAIKRTGNLSKVILPKVIAAAQKAYERIAKTSIPKADVRALVEPALHPRADRDNTTRDQAAAHPVEPWCEDYVWCNAQEKFINTSTMQMLTTTSFNNTHGRDVKGRWMDDDRQMSASHVALHEFQIPIVARDVYMPLQPPGQPYEDGGVWFLNTYRGIPTERGAWQGSAAVDAVIAHLHRVCGKVSGDHVIQYLAYTVQNPGKKIRHSIIIQGAEGIGKSLVGQLMTAVMGHSNVNKATPTVLASAFNAWAEGGCLCIVDELNITGQHKHEVLNNLKEYATNDTVTIHKKGRDPYTVCNTQNYLMFTNNRNALPLSEGDRRYYVIFSPYYDKATLLAAGMDDAYFDRLHALLASNVPQIRSWLLEMDVSGFSPHARAPDTAGKQAMVASAKPEEVLALEQLIADGSPGITYEVLSSAHVTTAMTGLLMDGWDIEVPKRIEFRRFMLRCGYSATDIRPRLDELGQTRLWVRDPSRILDVEYCKGVVELSFPTARKTEVLQKPQKQ